MIKNRKYINMESRFTGLTNQETYISLTDTFNFARYISNEGFYWNEEIKLWVGIFNGKDLTDSEIWDEFRKSKQPKNES